MINELLGEMAEKFLADPPPYSSNGIAPSPSTLLGVRFLNTNNNHSSGAPEEVKLTYLLKLDCVQMRTQLV